MFKNDSIVPMLNTVDTAMQKSCKPATLGRIWHASRRALNLEHSPAHQFACSQWQTNQHPSNTYLIYRWLIFIGVLSVAIASFVCQRIPRKYETLKVQLNYFKWFIYFTNWGFLLIVIQAGLALAVVHRHRREQFNIQIHEINALNLLVHGGNSCLMTLELCVTAHPFRAAHALYSAGAGLAYGIFSALYWALGGTDRIGLAAIYPALDWNKPGTSFGFVSLCAVVLVFAHALATCLALLRTRIGQRLRTTRQQADRYTLPMH